MKYKNGKELVGKHFNGNTCVYIYKIVKNKAILIWEALISCFSRGWNNDAGWNNDTGWNND